MNVSWEAPQFPNGVLEGYRLVYEPCTPVDGEWSLGVAPETCLAWAPSQPGPRRRPVRGPSTPHPVNGTLRPRREKRELEGERTRRGVQARQPRCLTSRERSFKHTLPSRSLAAGGRHREAGQRETVPQWPGLCRGLEDGEPLMVPALVCSPKFTVSALL